MAYLITGGTGFVGSRIVRDLVKDGEQVIAYDLFPQGTFLQQLLSDEERTRVKVVRGDVTDLPYLLHTVKKNNVDRIIHMAYLLTAATRANPPLAVKVNCDGTINIFETARILGLKKVVWAGSVAVFGPPEKYAEEYIPNDAPHYPFGIYGASKSFNETIAEYYFEEYGVDISAIRYGIVYGIGMERSLTADIIRELILNPAMGKPGKVPYGEDVFDWLYADDASRATLLAARAVRTKTRAFNTSGDVRTIKEAADYVRQLLPAADISLLPGRIGVSAKFDTTPIQEELGYRFQWSMEQGIKELINTVRRQHGLPLV